MSLDTTFNNRQNENIYQVLSNSDLNFNSPSVVDNSIDCKYSRSSLHLESVHPDRIKALQDSIYIDLHFILLKFPSLSLRTDEGTRHSKI